jgi:nitrate reductase gamma subunit
MSEMIEPQWMTTMVRIYTVCDRVMTIASGAAFVIMVAALVTLVVLIWRR